MSAMLCIDLWKHNNIFANCDFINKEKSWIWQVSIMLILCDQNALDYFLFYFHAFLFKYIDEDECIYDHICSYRGTCINTLGGFQCECDYGYRGQTCSGIICCFHNVQFCQIHTKSYNFVFLLDNLLSSRLKPLTSYPDM